LRVDAKALAAHERAGRRAGPAIAPGTRQLQGTDAPSFGPKVHSSAPDRKHCAAGNPARNAALADEWGEWNKKRKRGSCQISVVPTAPCFVSRARGHDDAPATRYACCAGEAEGNR